MENKKQKDKTSLGVIGFLLIIFGVIGTIPVLQNRQYIWLVILAVAVILGVILVAYSTKCESIDTEVETEISSSIQPEH